jgi:hypothetical protein
MHQGHLVPLATVPASRVVHSLCWIGASATHGMSLHHAFAICTSLVFVKI